MRLNFGTLCVGVEDIKVVTWRLSVVYKPLVVVAQVGLGWFETGFAGGSIDRCDTFSNF